MLAWHPCQKKCKTIGAPCVSYTPTHLQMQFLESGLEPSWTKGNACLCISNFWGEILLLLLCSVCDDLALHKISVIALMYILDVFLLWVAQTFGGFKCHSAWSLHLDTYTKRLPGTPGALMSKSAQNGPEQGNGVWWPARVWVLYPSPIYCNSDPC